MKHLKVLLLLLMLTLQGALTGVANPPENKSLENARFEDNFGKTQLRIDYMLSGNRKETRVYFREMKEEPFYGGPVKDLTKLGSTGSYRYCLYDSASGAMLYAKGFCTIFQEWQGTAEALRISRSFPMAAVMPYPLKPVRFTIEKRSSESGDFEALFTMNVNPLDYSINHSGIRKFPAEKIVDSGDPADHVDIAFLAEGYTADEMSKFISDAKSFADYFLKTPPFDRYGKKFNFYAVLSPSDESGVSIPGKGIYVNTSIGSSFYTFGMDRYLTAFDTKSIYDIAANVPCDGIFVLVNSKQYGGGGFYNHYCQSTSDNSVSRIVAVHEFGHSFAGLADEYVDESIAYTGFYNISHEPWERNITTNVNFASKWKAMVNDTVPLPTPPTAAYAKVTGLFEGAGYLAKGIYRPRVDCRMRSNGTDEFCPVCAKAIEDMIRYYCGKD
jgi:hypothetical protein